MTTFQGIATRQFATRILLSAALAAFVSACAKSGSGSKLAGSLGDKKIATVGTPQANTIENQLAGATKYWGAQLAKQPDNAQFALNYALNLKAMGSKAKALSVLATAHQRHPQHKQIASEYGRLVLASGNIELAEKVLRKGFDPRRKDWRLLSAMGTIHARQGKYVTAQKLFSEALKIVPQQASVLNNLALSYALDGKADRAEQLLRRAAKDNPSYRVQKNLAMLLKLQGKTAEAERINKAILPRQVARNQISEFRNGLQLPGASKPVAAPAEKAANVKKLQTADADEVIRKPLSVLPKLKDSQ